MDFFPNYTYCHTSNRFIRAPIQFADEIKRSNPPKPSLNFLYGTKALSTAFSTQNELARSFVGMPHILALVRIIGKENLPLLIDEVMNNINLKVCNIIAPYITELNEGMPPSSKLPRFDYGTQGEFEIACAS